MKLTQLKYFKTVAEVGRISQAAKVLFISPPALSSTITNLEKELGVTLFDRSSNHIVLNEQGRIFLRYVNRIFNELECAKLELQQSLAESDNSIRIAVTTSNNWISLISAFTTTYPQIMLSCDTLKIQQLQANDLSNLYSFILAEHNDFYPANMESVCLYEEQPVAILPANHPLARKRELQLEDLSDETLFLPTAGQSLNKRIKQLFLDHNVPLTYTRECSEATCRNLVSEGRGISFDTANNIQSISELLSYVPLSVPECHWTQLLYWNPKKQFTWEELAFKDFLLDMYHVPAQ